MKKRFPILIALVFLVAVFAVAGVPSKRTFKIRVEGPLLPDEISSYISEEGKAEPLNFRIVAQSGKGTVDIPVNAAGFFIKYHGIKSRLVPIPAERAPATIVLKIEETKLGGLPGAVGIDHDPFKITVLIVNDKSAH